MPSAAMWRGAKMGCAVMESAVAMGLELELELKPGLFRIHGVRGLWMTATIRAGEEENRRTRQAFPSFFVEEEKKRGRVRSKLRRRG